ncbi:MAG: TolC family protein, partial [Bacteroidetes bacterium]
MRGFPYERLFFLLLISTFFTSFGNAQEVWSLQRCIEYARDHSLNIKQADYNVTLAHVNARQARLERLPNLSASVTGGVQWGRTIDPTTNDFNNQRISFNSYGVNANALVYGGGRITNGIRQMDMQLKASEYDSDYAFNLTALNIANAYLQILQSEEQLE